MTEQTRNQPEPEATLLPAVDVIEDGEGITLYADLPGVPKDRLNLNIDADTLTIDAEIVVDTPQNLTASHAEVDRPRYRRVFALSKELDVERIKAEFNQGVLTLRIPKAQHAQRRRIEIQVV